MRDERPTITGLRKNLYAGALLQRSIVSLRRGLRAIGFWAAVVLPFFYAPLMLSGLDSKADTISFAVLFATHLIALLLGHKHEA